MSLLSELKRRNVFRVAATYAVIAWLLVQVSTTVLPQFGVPAWITRALIIVLAVGALPVLLLTWAFELTPEGLKTQAQADAAGLRSRIGGARLNVAIGVLLMLALGLFALGRYSAAPNVPSTPVPVPVPVPASALDAPNPPPAATDEASIAVLPFVNMSADKDNEYFSDGLSETLLNMLAQVPDLKVAGRTSSFAFKGKNEDLRRIGAALGVSNVLEGSVQKAGDTVRITAQLIAVSDSTHRWSKSYDRKLDDVFRIQDEIATEVVGALRVALQAGARERLTLKRTENIEAYQEYLQGLALMPKRKVADLRAAASHFERALALDPGFARAYVGAADTYLLLDDYDRHDEKLMARSKHYVERAMELSPTLGDAHASLALYLMRVQNLARVEPALERALELAPSHASAYQWYSSYLRAQPGRGADALAMSERAVALEPLSPIVHLHLGMSQAAAGRGAEGRATVARLVQQFPDYPAGHRALGEIAASEGDLVGALHAQQAHDTLDPDSSYRVRRCGILANFGATAPANECLARYGKMAPGQRALLTEQAVNGLMAGDAAQALALLDRTPDPDPLVRMAILLNLRRAPDALTVARQSYPEFLVDPAVEIGAHQRWTALLIGSILLHAGEENRGRALIQRVLRASAAASGTLEADWPWYEPVAHRLLGERDQAITALKQAVASGRFTELDSLDADVLVSGLRADPRYEAAVAPARAKTAEQVRLAQAAGLL